MKNHNPFRYFKTSPEIIRLAVMMYIKFPLSLRNVEDLLHERGIDICHETVHYWRNRFGLMFAREVRKKRIHSSTNYSNWKWHHDEGEVLEAFVSKRRDSKAALVFLKKIMKRFGKSHAIVTDRLRSYRAAMKLIRNELVQQVGRRKNQSLRGYPINCVSGHVINTDEGEQLHGYQARDYRRVFIWL